jgi:hypothetical protein
LKSNNPPEDVIELDDDEMEVDEDSVQVHILPKVTNIGLQIFVITNCTFYILLLVINSLVGQFFAIILSHFLKS